MPRPPRSLALELALVVLVSAAVFVPGVSTYSLVDPWETHYGEVGRMMLQNHDLVHTEWPGTNSDGALDEGFRSKPVLQFWMMAAGMRSVGLAKDGGYSGELVTSGKTMFAIRIPFVVASIFGLAMIWWMLAVLVSRRVAWLALIAVATCPMYCLMARQAMPDMPLCATVMGAIAMFVLAIEDGDRPIATLGQLRLGGLTVSYDTRHFYVGLVGAVVAWQALYYALYFTFSPVLAVRVVVPPALWLPMFMAVMMFALWSRPWAWLRRALVVERWGRARPFAEHVLGMTRITTMRQLYLLACYSLLGIGVLAKGPPGLAAVGVVGVLHIVLRDKWTELWNGAAASSSSAACSSSSPRSCRGTSRCSSRMASASSTNT
jgi:4-amino-4-deoxy-L-arabinose transferase-like glycosyltransferase